MAGPSLQPIVEMREITKVFPGVRALDQVNFSIYPGEIRGLVGKNGAGKSTLMHILTGIYPPNSGEIRVNGKTIPGLNSTIAKQLGIRIVHQHSQLIPPLSMAENIFCGSLPKNRFGIVDWQRLYREAQELIERLGLQIDVRRTIEGASVAERQMIEIVKAMFANARVVILDEATAPLPKSEVDLLFGFVRKLRDQGVSFVYISHYLEELFQLCDTVTILRDGKLAGEHSVSGLTQNDLIRYISGAQVDSFKRTVREVKNNQPVLQIEDLHRQDCYTINKLAIYEGEIVGLTGLDGCGKDSLARGLFGMEPLGTGTVQVNGKPIPPASEPKIAFAQGIAYLPRDRHTHGIVGIRPVRENVTLPILSKLGNRLGFLALDKEQNHVAGMIRKLNIKTPSQDQPVQFLSGGNQQKVVFAKLVGVQPKILLLDEPTQGVDVQAKVEIMKIIDGLSREGVCVVIISEEIRELLDICDRILVMYKGRIHQEFRVGEPETTIANILAATEGSLSTTKELMHETA